MFSSYTKTEHFNILSILHRIYFSECSPHIFCPKQHFCFHQTKSNWGAKRVPRSGIWLVPKPGSGAVTSLIIWSSDWHPCKVVTYQMISKTQPSTNKISISIINHDIENYILTISWVTIKFIQHNIKYWVVLILSVVLSHGGGRDHAASDVVKAWALKLRLHGTWQAARLRSDSRAAKIET